MNLVRYTYWPGWTQGDYTTWDSTIDESGVVRQHMNPEDGKTKRKHGVDIREAQLSESEVSTLVETLEGFDASACDYFRQLGICIEDVEDIGLHSDRFNFSYSGPLLTIQHMSKRGMREVDPDPLNSLLRVWRHVDRLQPHPAQRQKTKR